MTLRPLLTPICTKRFRQTLYSTMAPFSPRRLCDRQQPRQRRRPSFLRRSQAFRIPQAEMRNASRTIASRVSVIGLSAFLTFALTACGQQPEALVVGAPTECVDQPPVPPLTPEERTAAARYHGEHRNDPNNNPGVLAPPQSVIPADDACSQPAPVDTTPEPPDS
jgi:hypothetical protein